MQRLRHPVPLRLDRVAGHAARRVHELRDGAVGGDRPVGDDQQTVAGGLDLLHDVGAENHRAFAAQRVHQLADLDALVGVQPLGGLVQHQDLGFVQNRPGHAGALPVALRDFADGPEEHVLQAGFLDGAPDSLAGGGVVQAAQPGHVFQELADEHVVVQRVRLGQVAHARLGGGQIVADGRSVEADLALVGLKRSREHSHRGRLPRAVGAEEADDLPPVHLEGGPVHRHDGSRSAWSPLPPKSSVSVLLFATWKTAPPGVGRRGESRPPVRGGPQRGRRRGPPARANLPLFCSRRGAGGCRGRILDRLGAAVQWPKRGRNAVS